MSDPIDNDAFERARRALQREHAEAERERQGRRLARRLIVAFALIILLAAVFFVVLPEMGLTLDPIIPLLCFGVIAAAAIVAHKEGYEGLDDTPTEDDLRADARDAIARLPGTPERDDHR